MSSAFAVGKRSITWSVVVATIAWSMGLSLLVAPLAARAALPAAGGLIKGSLPAVYYYGTDNKRYVFPNEKTYKTWYADFSMVTTVTDAELASLAIGGNATYRPGVKMVKITTDPKVYAVGAGGTLRHVATEAVASALYGASWASMVEDVPDAFFVNYTIGAALNAAADWSPAAATAAATNIGVDKGLGGAAAAPVVPAGPAVLTASDGGSPGNATIPYNATDVIMAKVKFMGTGTVSSMRVTRTGLARDADVTALKLFDGTTQLGTSQTLNSAHQASFTGLSIAVAGEKILTIAADISNVNAGDILQLGLEAGSDVTLSSGSVGGSFPLRGGQMTISSVTIGAATLFRGPDMPTSDTQINPDQTDFRFTQVRIQAGSAEDLTVRQIVAIQSGTATASDIKDIKLVNDTAGTTLATITTLPANGRVVFDGLSVPIKKGEDVRLSVKASMGGGTSSGRTVGFDFHDGVAYTVRIVGNTFGFGITPTRNDFCATTGVTGGACQVQTVSQGTLRVSRASGSPSTGNIPQGGTQVPLVAVEYTVTGEEVRITSQNWDFAFGTMVCSELTAVTLYSASGNVVAGPQDCASNTVTFTDSMTLPAGTNTYTMKANIAQATSGGDTVGATLDVSEFTVRGVQSGKSTTVNTTTDVAGNTLTVQAAALTATTGATPIAGSVVAGVQDFTFTNLVLDASGGGEDAKVTSIVVTDATGTSALPNDLVNWELWGDADTSDANDAAVRIETTNSTAAATASANTVGIDSTVTFTLKTPIRIAKSKSATLQVKADVIAGATSGTTTAFAHQVNLNAAADITSTGWITGTAITETIGGAGQTQIVRATGTLKVELAADTSTAGPIVAGSSGVSMAKYKLTAAFEDVDITQLPLYLANGTTGAGTLGNVSKVKVYKDGTQIGNLAGYAFGNSANVTVVLDTGVLRATKDTPLYIELKADFNAKEQAASGTQARVGLGDSDGNATTWGTTRSGAAGSYQIVANGRDAGSTITATTITSTGAAGGVVAGGDSFGVFDGVLTVGLDANSPSGVQTAGTAKEALRFWLTATGDEITVYDLEFITSGSATDSDITGTGDATLFNTDRSITYATWATGEIASLIPMDAGTGGLHVNNGENTTDDAGGWTTTLIVGAGQTKVLLLVGDTTGAGGASTSKSFQTVIGDGAATGSGVQWMDGELSGLDGTCTTQTAATDLATGAECVVDSASYTKTLPVNGNGLTYN
ncbi:MAG: hypothetical protein Q7R80_01845 [bacterium]|nr:hypothetical protein [bacterium]